jgi:ATP-dependent helicase/nuclease subunit B
LKLEPIKEPEEGMDQLQLGSLYHEILEHTYRRIADDKLAITTENRDRALEILDEECQRLLPTAPNRHGFRATAIWPQEQNILRRKLKGLVDADFSGDLQKSLGKLLDGIRYAYRQEVRFGFDDQEPIVVDGEAGRLRVRGAIDRMDVVDGQVLVFDYKSGSGTILKEEMVDGRNVQMMLYILVAQQLLEDMNVGGAAFWHIGRNGLSGEIRADDPQIEDARRNLHERIALGRQGIFVNVPSKPVGGHCSAYCEFSQLCRIDRASARKEIRLDTASE